MIGDALGPTDDQHGEVLDEHLLVLLRGPSPVQDHEGVQLG